MQAQHHARRRAHIEAIIRALAAWEADPTSGRGRAARPASSSELTAALLEHLDLEEREILPLASRHSPPPSGTSWASTARTR